MTIHLVTFSDESMSQSRRLCMESAVRHGVEFPHWFSYEVSLLSPLMVEHREVFNQPRGCGLWAWKPAIISQLLNNESEHVETKEGDIVIYSDAGVEFLNNVNHIIDRMDQDIFLFGNMWEHAHWCKRDIIEAVWPLPTDRQSFIDAGVQMSTPSNLVAFNIDSIENLYTWARFGKQVQASVIFFRVSDYTKRFVKEWLDWCLFEGGRLIDDSPSRTPNHPEFKENRHDQAILTTLAYREGIKLHWWPASYNDGAFTYERGDYPDEGYPVSFNHHRKRNNEWSVAA